jgi:SIR2-like protein
VDAAEFDKYCKDMLRRMERSAIVPFLGAGANRCGRPPDAAWTPEAKYLPDGGELSSYLAGRYEYPGPDRRDLGRVSQYATLEQDQSELYADLREIFAGGYTPTGLHTFLAELPGEMSTRGRKPPYKLIVTTNYDDALETAFKEADQKFDLVYYAAANEQNAGQFMQVVGDEHLPVDRQYALVDGCPVILKIHGAVDRANDMRDSYVITEDDYIDYLAGANIETLMPSSLVAAMRGGSFLFLGYGLRDWNLRVILKHIWNEQLRRTTHWAVQHDADELDRMFWDRQNVKIVVADLMAWVEALRRNFP